MRESAAVFIDCSTLTGTQEITADLCIVGAGAAGITLAKDLINSGLSVCLLEAGGYTPDESDQTLSNAVNTGSSYRGLNLRARAFGGNTHYWAGMCAPLAPDDFESRSWIDDTGWPIQRETLDPYYKKAQRTCEVGAFEYDAQTISDRRGVPTLPLDEEQVETIVYQNSPPTRFGTTYRTDFLDQHEITVYLHAALTEVELNDAKTSVTSITARSTNARLNIVATRFCFAMGGIENARHLMILAQQEGLSLDGESDRLGQFLEHPHYGPGAYALLRGWDNHRMYRMTSIDTYDDDFPNGKRAKVFGGLSLTAEARARAQLPAHACTLVEVQIDDEIRFADADTAPTLASIKPLLAQGEGEFKLYKLNMRCEQRRVPACRLRMSDEIDELGLPIAELNWVVSDEDHEAYHQTLIQIGAALGKSGLGRLYTPMSHGRVYSPDPPEGGWHHSLQTQRGPPHRRSGHFDRCWCTYRSGHRFGRRSLHLVL